MTKNLITGPGFVASHLADYLLEKGEEVYVTYRWTDNKEAFKHIEDKVKWVLMDLNDLSSCIKAVASVKPDYIFHLGAQSYVSASFSYPIETFRTNGEGTLNLLEAVRMNKAEEYNPIIHVCSSSEVYGLVDDKDIPIKETTRFNPSNPYAVSKVAEDMWALMYYTNYGLKTIRTRFFTHTGPRRTMLSAEVNFAKQIALIEKGKQEPILKHGNLNSIRTFADVRDAVKGYYILSRKGKPGEVYNIGGDYHCSIGEMLDYLISLSPLKDKIVKQQDPNLMRPYDVTLQIPDCSKFKELGWKPEIPFSKTMSDLLEYWRNNV